MMHVKIINKLKTRSIYTQLIITYIVLMIALIAILSTVLYSRFSHSALQAIKLNAKERLTQSANQLVFIRKRSISLGLQLMSDGDVRSVMYSNNIPEEEKSKLMHKLDRIVVTDTMIHSIFIYKMGNVINTLGTDYNPNFNMRINQILNEYRASHYKELIPSKITYVSGNGLQKSDNIISVVFSEYSDTAKTDDLSVDKQPDFSALIINLNADEIQKSIASITKDTYTKINVCDSKGRIIFDSTGYAFGENISNSEYSEVVQSLNKPYGDYVKNINKKKSLVVYINSQDPSWSFISTATFEDLFGELNSLKIFILIICIVIFSVGLILSVLAANKIYLPFNHLIGYINAKHNANTKGCIERESLGDIQYLTSSFNAIFKKANELEVSVKQNTSIVKRALLKKALTQNYDIDSDFTIKYTDMFENNFECVGEEVLSVILFSIDKYIDFTKKYTDTDLVKAKGSLEMLILKLLSQYIVCEIMDSEDSYIYILVKASESILSTDCKDIINSIQEDLEKSLEQQVSCTIGMPVKNITDIHISGNSAIEMMKYKYVFGYRSLLGYDLDIISSRKDYISIDKNLERLVQSIRGVDYDQMDIEVDKLFYEIKECQYDYIMLILNQIILELIKSIQTTDDDDKRMDFSNVYSNMSRIETLEEMKTFIKLYCTGLISRLEKKKSNIKSDIINGTLDYINENYYKSSISVESLADRVKLSPGYFGKIFCDTLGKSVSEYIIQLRLSKSVELLLNTSLSINEISGKAGFNNSTYFTTIFKKSFGISPNQYRQINKIDTLLE